MNALKDIYEEFGTTLDSKARQEAVNRTGLSWIQIYKWLFDQKSGRHDKKEQKQHKCCGSKLFRVVDKSGDDKAHSSLLFKVEKVSKQM